MKALLNLGCGKDIREGWTNVDRFPGKGIDIVCDIAQGLPIPSDCMDYAFASNILEHIANWEDVVLEVHRVLKPGGLFEIVVPYGLNLNTYHKRFFHEETMDGFIPGTQFYDSPSIEGFPVFDLVRREVNRRYPFAWHIKTYLGIILPIGRKDQITWVLRKREEVSSLNRSCE